MSEKERRHEESKTRWESKENATVKEETMDVDVNDVDKANL